MADDVEGQLAGLGAHQLGLQEGGPLLLQQPLTAHVVLGARLGEGRGWVTGASGPTRPRPRPAFPSSHWAPGSAPPPPPPDWLAHVSPASRPGRPCRPGPPWTCGACRRSQTRWLSPRRRSRRPERKGWLPQRRRPLRRGWEGRQRGLGVSPCVPWGPLGENPWFGPGGQETGGPGCQG